MTTAQVTRKIRFLHIPKTAGSSFDECLFIQYFKAYILRQRFTFTGNFAADQQRYRQIPTAERKKIVLYTGHAPLTTGVKELDHIPTLTFLRNPVDRVISYCQHVSEGKSLNISGGIDCKNMDIDQFLSSGRTQLSNFQSKIILGRESYNLPKESMEDLVTQALYALEHKLSCFGITEDFDRSLLMFSHVLSWEKPPIYRYRNKKNSDSLIEFEARHIEKIKELNKIDLLVYERALILFDKKIRGYGEEFEEELALFKEKLRRRHAIFPAMDFARCLRKKLSR
ncbi:MAG: sulfotransferase family 2 domain-containing protein [Proteobacteria bacterium]|nr:sulfotransferase family 2 domain-containing protein [Pseudomonadota bacterium]